MDVIASGLSIGLPALVGWPPVGTVLTGVAVSPSGTIYVAGDVDNVLYRIRNDDDDGVTTRLPTSITNLESSGDRLSFLPVP